MNLSKFFLKLFIPHKSNNHHAYFLRTPILILVISLLTVLTLKDYKVYNPPLLTNLENILGFSTNISKDEIIRLTNEERIKNGLPLLTNNPKLDLAAYQKAQDMMAKNYWAHFAPDGKSPWDFIAASGYRFKFAGENLAKSFDNSSQVVSAWMGSTGHKENILNPRFTEIGISQLNGQNEGEETTLVVQIFATPSTTIVARSQNPTTPSKKVTSIKKAEVKKSPNPSVKNQNINGEMISQSENIIPKVEKPILNTSINTLLSSTPAKILTFLTILFFLSLFLLDLLIISSKNIKRQKTSHLKYHLIALTLLLFIITFVGKGTIL